jgi:cob(I)alamin adenosyltransferase
MNTPGMIHIYTGTGKGKTTAAVGLAVRALGHGMKVLYVYFHKNPEKYGYTEIASLAKLGAIVKGFAGSHPGCDKALDEETIKHQCRQGLEYIQSVFKQNTFDLIILDEILISVRDSFIGEMDLLGIIKEKPACVELVMTGRDATKELIEVADYVSHIEKIKHPFDKGVTSREGIEF